MPIRLYYLKGSNTWSLAFYVGAKFVRVHSGHQTMARAIAAANDVCARLGVVPQFLS